MLDEDVLSYYEDELPIGALVTLRHRYFGTMVSGEIRAVKRFGPVRVTKEEVDYDYVLFTYYRIQLAGLKQWFLLEKGKEAKWEIEVFSTDLAAKKLNTIFGKEQNNG
jgi:hypothetical protein